MPARAEMTISAEFTGREPNLKPAASAFARMIREMVNPDGTFTDPELEAEFLEWMKNKTERSA